MRGEASSLLRQAQVALLGFEAGVSMAADLRMDGFDTHAKHEPMLQHLIESIDYLWNSTEQLGIAGRLTVFAGSDFGRTPACNSADGKDHWPVGSALFMQKGASWGSRVIDATDDLHFASEIDAASLAVTASGGRHIYPGDVQRTMRVLINTKIACCCP